MNTEKHFKLTEESIINSMGVKLFRIQATKDSMYADEGELGGWVEKERNLSDNAWVAGNAQVFGNAKILNNALVNGDALIYENASVYGEARVYGRAQVFGNAKVCGNAKIFGSAYVFDHVIIQDDAKVFDHAVVSGYSRILGNAWVNGVASLQVMSWISGNATITSNDDFCSFQNFGSHNRTTTFFREGGGNIKVNCGCFTGSIDEFEKEVRKTHGDNKHAKEYLAIIEVAIIKFGL
ncbi:hypothetical protein SAMN05443429_11248 [Cruoricaptor ignavus]|uniref:Polymer-forming protein n=1 Tax=Cruoricaptor ignavus TaxID=1118202 RepID=A0A1M6HFW0_9FLAO|nr:hypothetical protein [Cruoricaptor ignavus]SHJ21057.1 hypothetical protein SAMN05443429_11248 [Cruoricaptor ignavus]